MHKQVNIVLLGRHLVVLLWNDLNVILKRVVLFLIDTDRHEGLMHVCEFYFCIKIHLIILKRFFFLFLT